MTRGVPDRDDVRAAYVALREAHKDQPGVWDALDVLIRFLVGVDDAMGDAENRLDEIEDRVRSLE